MQTVFVREYLQHGDLSRAIFVAGYRHKGDPAEVARKLIENSNAVAMAIDQAKRRGG